MCLSKSFVEKWAIRKDFKIKLMRLINGLTNSIKLHLTVANNNVSDYFSGWNGSPIG